MQSLKKNSEKNVYQKASILRQGSSRLRSIQAAHVLTGLGNTKPSHISALHINSCRPKGPKSIANSISIDLLLKNAGNEEARGKIAEAIRIYNQIIEISPEFAKAYINCGNAYIKLSNYSKAFDYFQKALEFERNADILFKMGMIFYFKYQFTDAVNFFLECVTVDPSYKDGHLYSAQALSRIGEFSKALFFLDKTLELNHEHSQALKEKVEVLYKLKRYQETKILAQRLIRDYPDNYQFHRYLGFAELFTGNFQKAEKAFKSALDKNPMWRKRRGEDKSKPGKLNFNFPKDTPKLKELESGFIQKKDHRSLGYLYFYKGDHNKAIKAFEQAKVKLAN